MFGGRGSLAPYRLSGEARGTLELAGNRGLDSFLTPAGADAESCFIVGGAEYGAEYFGANAAAGIGQVAEAYIHFDDFLGSGSDAWLGRRHYHHESGYLDNHYWLAAGQGAHYGFGVEGLRLGPGRLKLAMLRAEDEAGGPDSIGGTGLDVRYSGLPANRGGALILWGLGMRRGAQPDLGLEAANGFGIGAWHHQRDLLGGSNTLKVTYRKGAAVMHSTCGLNPARASQGYDLAEATAWEVDNHFKLTPSDRLSVQWGVLAHVLDFGRRGAAGSQLHWYSTGVRSVIGVTDWVDLAAEFSMDRVNDEYNERMGSVRKFSLMLEMAGRQGAADGPPMLRLFFSNAKWSEKFGASLGTAPDDVPEGWAAGIRVESRW